MTVDEKIAALRATHEASTRGPWAIEPHQRENEAVYRIAACDCNTQGWCGHEAVVQQLGCSCCDVGLTGRAEDFAAIVSDHNNFPALLKALEDVLVLARRELHDISCGFHSYAAISAAVRACSCWKARVENVVEAALAEVDHG